MGILTAVSSRVTDFKRRKALEILTTSQPADLVAYGEKELIRCFKRAALQVPAYRRLLAEHRVPVEAVRDIPSFTEQVPVITKDLIFPHHSLRDLCVEGSFDSLRSIMTSSGFSGKFAYGISSTRNRQETIFGLDTTLDYTFQTSRKKTLFINCLPMGVTIPTTLPVADTSVRSDMALAILTKLKHEFDQFLCISDPHFLKKILEDGLAQGLDWKTINIHLITGDDWVPESFRTYLGNILGTDWETMERGFIGGTMGICELGLSLFHESRHSVRIQRLAAENRALRYALYGDGVEVLPTLFHYYPHRTYLELAGEGTGPRDLVISTLGDTLMMPMFRYNVQDAALLIPYERLVQVLSDHGHAELAPDLKLPLVAIFGRTGRMITTATGTVTPEQIKEGLYRTAAVAAATTGHFKLSSSNGIAHLEVQLRKGLQPDQQSIDLFTQHLLSCTSATCQLRLYSYQQYPHQMELDYERKFRNID